MLVIPDASVLLKWVLPGPAEEDVAQAMGLRDAAIRGEIVLQVPALWLYEVGNTLARHFPDQAYDLIDAFLSFDLEEGEPSDAWLRQTLVLTREYGVTFYDAAYHALAIIQKGIFVTADQKYIGKAKAAGSIVALRDWEAVARQH